MADNTRHVATISVYVYGTAEQAFNEAQDICNDINAEHDCQAAVEELHVQPFATLIAKKIDFAPFKARRIEKELEL